MRFLLLLLSLVLQLNVSGYANCILQENHVIETLNSKNSGINGRSNCVFRFQGRYENSETGLYYNYNRYYDPDSGNYLSQDPIGLAWNNSTLYAYVHDPNSCVDVFGLDCVPVPNKTKADYDLFYKSNPKHTLGQHGNRLNAGIEPKNSLNLFGKSELGANGNRFSLDANNNVYRFSSTNDGTWHWSGSTGQAPPHPNLTSKQVGNDMINKFGLKHKGW